MYTVIVVIPGLAPTTAGEYRTRIGARMGAWLMRGRSGVNAYAKRIAR